MMAKTLQELLRALQPLTTHEKAPPGSPRVGKAGLSSLYL
jgi:hypothetical protein